MNGMEQYTVWDTRTGDIVQTGICPVGHGYRQAIYAWQQADAGYHNPREEWHDGTGFKPRSTMVLECDGAVVRGLPIPAKAVIDGTVYEIDDGTAELSFNLPGEYRVTFKAEGFKDYELSIAWPASPTAGLLSPS